MSKLFLFGFPDDENFELTLAIFYSEFFGTQDAEYVYRVKIKGQSYKFTKSEKENIDELNFILFDNYIEFDLDESRMGEGLTLVAIGKFIKYQKTEIVFDSVNLFHTLKFELDRFVIGFDKECKLTRFTLDQTYVDSQSIMRSVIENKKDKPSKVFNLFYIEIGLFFTITFLVLLYLHISESYTFTLLESQTINFITVVMQIVASLYALVFVGYTFYRDTERYKELQRSTSEKGIYNQILKCYNSNLIFISIMSLSLLLLGYFGLILNYNSNIYWTVFNVFTILSFAFYIMIVYYTLDILFAKKVRNANQVKRATFYVGIIPSIFRKRK